MLFSNVWGENSVLFERLMEIHSNPPILYYGFKQLRTPHFLLFNSTSSLTHNRVDLEFKGTG